MEEIASDLTVSVRPTACSANLNANFSGYYVNGKCFTAPNMKHCTQEEVANNHINHSLGSLAIFYNIFPPTGTVICKLTTLMLTYHINYGSELQVNAMRAIR